MNADEAFRDARRYRALKAWLIAAGNFVCVIPADSEPFVMGDKFYGATFDAAVDTLPESKYGEPIRATSGIALGATV